MAKRLLPTGSALVILAALAGPPGAWAATDPGAVTWNPVASERLVKLPGSYLRRAIDNDFAGSSLASEIRDVQGLMSLKAQTLADLQNAVEQSDGDLRVELQHQFLAEKREYLELASKHQDLRRQQMTVKQRLLRRLLGKLDRQEAANTPERAALIEKQEAARSRLEGTISQVDIKIFNNPTVGQSKYSKEYAKNVLAIERLVQAIKAHPMNEGSEIDGRPVTKKEYLRQLMAETEADLQIVDQEATVLGYMAKLIALDALALSDLLSDPTPGDGSDDDDGEETGITAAVDFFVAQ
ncbi:MAG: hypothetical protein AAF495_14690 [Pseudomonadota bacterium]